MTTRKNRDLPMLALLVAASRFAFRSRDLYDIDSVNFGLAMGRFDPRVHQPHPPGYFLYVCLGRLIHLLVPDANLSLVLLSIAASIGVVVLIYLQARQWFGLEAARFAALLFLVSPLAWFHGTVALTYSVEALFSALLGWLCWRLEQGQKGWTIPAALLLGISAGIRPTSLMFLGPLYLYSLRRVGVVRALAGIVALGVACACWYFPMLQASGGAATYYDALNSLWRLVPSTGTVFNSSPATSIARAVTCAFILFLGFGPALLAPLGECVRSSEDPRASVDSDSERKARIRFTLVWTLPALGFFVFIFLKFVNSGYLLLVCVPVCIWLGKSISTWFLHSTWPRGLRYGVLFAGLAVEVAMFLANPVYCSYTSVQRFEAQLDGVRREMPQVGSADDLLIVGFDAHFLGYRHAGYYLPDYQTIEYPEVNLIEGNRIFSMQGGDTHLLTELPAGSWKRFVLCPLPREAAENAVYTDKVIQKLPSGDLQRVTLGGRVYVTAPIQDLALLYPIAAKASPRGVYTALHSR